MVLLVLGIFFYQKQVPVLLPYQSRTVFSFSEYCVRFRNTLSFCRIIGFMFETLYLSIVFVSETHSLQMNFTRSIFSEFFLATYNQPLHLIGFSLNFTWAQYQIVSDVTIVYRYRDLYSVAFTITIS